MASKILKDFQAKRKTAEASLKGEKDFAAMLKLVKDYSKLEASMGALDKAIDAKDGAKARSALSDFLKHAGVYRGKIAGELTKIKKKAEGAEDTDAFADTTLLLSQLLTEEQHTPQKVQSLATDKGEEDNSLETTALYSQWVGVKKLFEAETGQKKPSATYLKKIRASSGLETALKAVDLATKKNNVAALRKALLALDTKAKAYAKLVAVQKGVVVNEDDEGGHDDDQNPDYQKSVKKLLQGLNLCRNKAHAVLDNAN